MSIGAGVVITISFQQVDDTPNAKASAEGNNEGLQSVDGRSEKLHILLLFSGLYPAMRIAAPYKGGSVLGAVAKQHRRKNEMGLLLYFRFATAPFCLRQISA